MRKVAVAVMGFGVLLLGLALIVLPGPAILVLPLGLAILAKEFPWARKLLDKLERPLRWVKTVALRALGKLRHGFGSGRAGQPRRMSPLHR
jgi:hypothetical protein